MEGCVMWLRSHNGLGYGVVRRGGRIHYVHRITYEAAHGPLKPGEQVLHRCDNPPCYNVDHLFAGDQHVNLRDMTAKGRHWQTKKKFCPRGHLLDRLVVRTTRTYRTCSLCKREYRSRGHAHLA